MVFALKIKDLLDLYSKDDTKGLTNIIDFMLLEQKPDHIDIDNQQLIYNLKEIIAKIIFRLIPQIKQENNIMNIMVISIFLADGKVYNLPLRDKDIYNGEPMVQFYINL